MKKLLLALCCVPNLCFAHNIKLNKVLPQVEVKTHGELLLKDNDVVYEKWNTKQLQGKVRVIQAIAGRSASKEMNAPLMKSITAQKFDTKDYQTITIINQDDAMWGTGGFVKSSAQDSKKEFSWSSLVLDENGAAAKAWQLKKENSIIIIVDKSSKVIFVHEGALSKDEIKNAISTIKNTL
ncbi:YtfJ family protein [Pseudoalteromonas sp. C2R02]|uniref:YtfJ family protein n=1 Tax=Pseudoalteromonas sp. C2R02 TaxID=2841565 RepID=UPI001C093440|nr:YtfJ family protein [Pseudoalteromonas sp. C2R02]MBU2970974.1 YtfJ family protein [Pseudoalteromonas sp. C2R02]